MATSTFTYHTLLRDSAAADAALCAYARRFGEVVRDVFVQITRRGGDATELKPELCRKHGVTARQYNAARFVAEGKIDGVKAHRKGLIAGLKTQIKRAQQVLKELWEPSERKLASETPAQKQTRLEKHHHKKRRLEHLNRRLEKLEADHKQGIVHVAFGTAKLFRAQFNLEANGYENHAAWLKDWRAARSSQFFVLGSKDENSGCQGCVATVNEADESLELRVRLPDAVLADPSIERVDGNYVILKGIKFARGHENVLQALHRSRQAWEAGDTKHGVALSYRFVREEKHGEPLWYVHVSVDVTAPPIVTRRERGAVAPDFNSDHLAVAEIDRSGNLKDHKRINTFLRTKTTDQRAAILGDAAKKVVERALAAGKPIVVEKLDFQKKKAQLEGVDRRRARMLSALAYRKFDQLLKAACFRAGVEVIEVDPAYTSVIGAINNAQIMGVSTHIAAAYVLARRGLKMSEAPRASVMREGAFVPTRNGGHIALLLPADSGKLGWKSFWGQAAGRLRARRKAYYRSGEHKRDPAPLSLIKGSGCNPVVPGAIPGRKSGQLPARRTAQVVPSSLREDE